MRLGRAPTTLMIFKFVLLTDCLLQKRQASFSQGLGNHIDIWRGIYHQVVHCRPASRGSRAVPVHFLDRTSDRFPPMSQDGPTHLLYCAARKRGCFNSDPRALLLAAVYLGSTYQMGSTMIQARAADMEWARNNPHGWQIWHWSQGGRDLTLPVNTRVGGHHLGNLQ